jgi:ABC-type Fe3+ transport system substrate-binding protein
MKKFLTAFSAILISLHAFAQEHSEEMDQLNEEYQRESWSDTTKWVMLAVFAVFTLILVIRTFRNKPSA